jgi:hypothetical protein
MRLRNARQSFAEETLSSLPHLLARLCYVFELRDGSGEFSHWGLERTYGVDKARAAIRDCFYDDLLALTRTGFDEAAPMLADQGTDRQETLANILAALETVPAAGKSARLDHMIFSLKILLMMARGGRLAA